MWPSLRRDAQVVAGRRSVEPDHRQPRMPAAENARERVGRNVGKVAAEDHHPARRRVLKYLRERADLLEYGARGHHFGQLFQEDRPPGRIPPGDEDGWRPVMRFVLAAAGRGWMVDRWRRRLGVQS